MTTAKEVKSVCSLLSVVASSRVLCVQKLMPPVLKTHHAATDTADDYRLSHGYLGPALHAAVTKLRQSATTPSTLSQSTALAGGVAGLLSRPSPSIPFLQVVCANMVNCSNICNNKHPVSPGDTGCLLPGSRSPGIQGYLAGSQL